MNSIKAHMMSSFSFNPLILFQNWPEQTRDWATMNKIETGGDEEALSSADQVIVVEMVVKIYIWWCSPPGFWFYGGQHFDLMMFATRRKWKWVRWWILMWWYSPPGFWFDGGQDFDFMVVKILIGWYSGERRESWEVRCEEGCSSGQGCVKSLWEGISLKKDRQRDNSFDIVI